MMRLRCSINFDTAGGGDVVDVGVVFVVVGQVGE